MQTRISYRGGGTVAQRIIRFLASLGYGGDNRTGFIVVSQKPGCPTPACLKPGEVKRVTRVGGVRGVKKV